MGVYPPSHRPLPGGVIGSLSITSVRPIDYQSAYNSHYTSDGAQIPQDLSVAVFLLRQESTLLARCTSTLNGAAFIL